MLYRQKKLSEMKNDFINNVTHEFKTPIATITFAVANIENEKVLENPALIKQFTQVIKDENKRLNTQVEKVLQASILENKALELKNEKVDMQTIIQSLATAYEVKAGKEHFHQHFHALQTIVTGDTFHLSNTISNLLDNALKYSGEQVSITISTENVGKMLKISIADEGIGISPAQQKLIFEKFYRVPTGNVHNVKGFGLGLSYVKAIVEQHKGRVEVESKAGKGSTFSVFLPTV
jgi:two-component system phosphate regulon sensor histidine kinase PhoR